MQVISYRHSDRQLQAFVVSSYVHQTKTSASHFRSLLAEGAQVVVGVGDDVDPANVLPDDPLFGYAIAHNGALHWVFVKRVETELEDGTIYKLRGQGFAKQLIESLGFERKQPIPITQENETARRWNLRGWRLYVPSPANDNGTGDR